MSARVQKNIERIKTALIVLLTASALLLGRQTMLFDDFFKSFTLFGDVAEFMRGADPGAAEMGVTIQKEAARPLAIVVTDSEGNRYGIKYDTVARNAVYDRTSSILGEALGSESAPMEIYEEEWREALSRPGVYFEYFEPVKLSILDNWLNTRLPDTAGDTSLRRVFVAFGEEKSRVYYQDAYNGTFYAADTASSSGKAQELEIYSENGAQFAFETGIAAAENAPYMLIFAESEHQDVRAAAPADEEELLDITLRVMGRLNESYASYNSNDMLVRVGTQFNVRADSLGRVTYRHTEATPQSGEERGLSESEIIARAYMIATDTIGSKDSGAEMFYESFEYGLDGSLSVYFGYYIAGGRIHLLDDGHAARITFVGGEVVEMELCFRSFTLSGEYTKMLPERLTLAAAGGEFMLCYHDTGAERILPSWVVYS